MSDALHCAIRLLARREHGLAELANKLTQRGFETDDIQTALATCERQGLQSDRRYVESLCRTRTNQGYGPLRMRQELQAKHVSRELIDDVLYGLQSDWFECAMRAWEKKYSSLGDVSFADKQKQRQFLLYRGFTMETIAQVVS